MFVFVYFSRLVLFLVVGRRFGVVFVGLVRGRILGLYSRCLVSIGGVGCLVGLRLRVVFGRGRFGGYGIVCLRGLLVLLREGRSFYFFLVGLGFLLLSFIVI